jgi:hypothetical protein
VAVSGMGRPGAGTQGQTDQVRIYNYARCVRGG